MLADNRSNDGSGAIAKSYADSDKRIRFLTFDEHLPQRPNYNRALLQMAGSARYCKIVQADDRISENCIEQMLQLATRHPSAGVIGAVRQVGDALDPPDATKISEFTPGKEICRATLSGKVYAFGSPTSVMYRADLVRARSQFFNPDAFFDDTDAVFDLLRETDFCFCRKLLSHTTRDPDSQFGCISTYDFDLLYRYMTTQRIGGDFFTAAELSALRNQLARQYHEAVVSAVWRRADRADYLKFHRSVLRNTAGMHLSPVEFASAFMRVALRKLRLQLPNAVVDGMK